MLPANSITSFILAFCAAPCLLIAQKMETKSLSPDQQKELIIKVGSLLRGSYVYEDSAQLMANLVEGNLKKGNYNKISQPHEFASAVLNDLHSICNDRHLVFSYNPAFANNQIHTQNSHSNAIPELTEL